MAQGWRAAAGASTGASASLKASAVAFRADTIAARQNALAPIQNEKLRGRLARWGKGAALAGAGAAALYFLPQQDMSGITGALAEISLLLTMIGGKAGMIGFIVVGISAGVYTILKYSKELDMWLTQDLGKVYEILKVLQKWTHPLNRALAVLGAISPAAKEEVEKHLGNLAESIPKSVDSITGASRGSMEAQMQGIQQITGQGLGAETMSQQAKTALSSVSFDLKTTEVDFKTFNQKTRESVEEARKAWQELQQDKSASAGQKESGFLIYLKALKVAAKDTSNFVAARLSDLGWKLETAISAGAPEKELQKIIKGMEQLRDQGSAAMTQFVNQVKQTVDGLRGQLRSVNQQLEDPGKQHKKNLLGIDDTIDKATRSVQRRGMTDAEKQTESFEHIRDTMGEAKGLAEKGDEESLKRAAQLYREALGEAQQLKNEELALSAIETAGSSLKEIEIQLEKQKRAELETTKMSLENQI
ncbi:hypothetical protein ACFL2Q_19240 [Thermodesulfobacteriota bacterium]